jgi:hypothetical protein
MAKGKKELDAQEGFEEESSTNNPLNRPKSVEERGLDEEDALDNAVGSLDYEESGEHEVRPYGEMDGELEGRATVPMSELRKVRSEAAKYRKRLRQLESKMEKEKREAELAKMEETDRLKAIAEEAEAKAKAFRLKAEMVARQAAVINVASALGFYNPKDAASLIDLGQIEFNDDGTVDEEKTNELVKSLVESKPYLIKGQEDTPGLTGVSPSPGGFGPTNPPSSNWPRPKLRSKDQIDRLKQQSAEAMRSGKVAAAVRLYNRAWEMERGIKRK